jgi:hypothetical protein
MGIDLQLRFQCPDCDVEHDIAWLGRKYHYTNEDDEFSTIDDLSLESEVAKKKLLFSFLKKDPEIIEERMEDLILIGVRLCLARILEEQIVTIYQDV